MLLLLVLLAIPSIGITQEAKPWAVTYRTKIGARDHMNHKGLLLFTAADIVRQERFHVHTGVHVDPEDTKDSFCTTKVARDKFFLWLKAEGAISPADATEIMYETPLVDVTISEGKATARVVPPAGVPEQVKQQKQQITRQAHKVAVLSKETLELRRMLEMRRLMQLQKYAIRKGWDKHLNLPFGGLGPKGKVSKPDVAGILFYFEWCTLKRRLRQ